MYRIRGGSDLLLVGSLCLIFAACASSAGPARRSLDSPLADWVHMPPADCAVGFSGPTLNPGSAIRNARFSAIEMLAAASLAVDVQSMSGVGPYGSFEVSAQALSGSLENARIVSLWSETEERRDGRGRATRRLKRVYALACWPDASLGTLLRPAYPAWLIDPDLATVGGNDSTSANAHVDSTAGRICATGIAGPTWKSADQPAKALRDAQSALAVALESRIEKRIFDDGYGAARIVREVEPSSAARARSSEAEALEREWFDARGEGPIGLPEIFYGLACIDA